MNSQRSGKPRACDPCRRRKVRCESGGEPGAQNCSRCVHQGIECTYNATPQWDTSDSRQIKRLRKRCDELENRLSQMQQLMNSTSSGSNAVVNLSSFNTSASLPPGPYVDAPNTRTTMHSNDLLLPVTDDDDSDSSDDEYGNIRLLTEHVEGLSLATDAGHSTFHGKSSLTGVIVQVAQASPSPPREIDSASHSTATSQRHLISWMTARNGFSLRSSSADVDLNFPEPSLLHELAEIYFARANPWTGLLHRPTFFRSVEKGLHHEDRGFGSVVLLVCALGAIHSDDPRHLDDYGTNTNDADSGSVWQSAGWKWASQIDPMRNALSHTPSLYDLQMYALSLVTFHAYPTAIDLCGLAGMGVRRAQVVGAHRQKAYGGKLTIEGELWKRAFWSLLSTETLLCVALGRPCSTQDCDLDLPVDCDDEFWDHPDPERRFIQPVGNPSSMSFRIATFKLREILASASRTIYSTKKSRILSGLVGPDWERRVVTELDSSLNRWQALLPAHLRWDPDRSVDLFYIQSACLACMFYHTQTFIHRRFISVIGSHTPSPLVEASTLICLNAARSCGNIVITLPRTRSYSFAGLFGNSLFECLVILVINVSRRVQRGEQLSEQEVRDLDIASKCLAVAEYHEQRSFAAGRLRHILCHFAYSCGLSPVWSLAKSPIPSTAGATGIPSDTSRFAPDFTQQNLLLQDDFARWMTYEALQTEFNPFGTLIQEPADSPFFGFPFDLNGGSAIDGGAAMGTSTNGFPSSSSSDVHWG